MPHLPHTGTSADASRWSLRREAPSTVAILTRAGHFAAMRRYPSFAFADHDAYLHQVHGLLRFLHGQGIHTRAAQFDAREYAAYCLSERLDADTAASRARYTAEVAGGGVTLPYEGQPMGRLVRELLALHHPDFAAQGTGGWDVPGSPERIASVALTRLLAGLGTGSHHVVCSVRVTGSPLVAELHVERGGERAGAPDMGPGQLSDLHGVLTAAFATGSAGGLVARTRRAGPPRSETVRGWSVENDWLRPLSAGEVFAAYCTDARTGHPVPPEPHVRHAAGFDLPRPWPPGR